MRAIYISHTLPNVLLECMYLAWSSFSWTWLVEQWVEWIINSIQSTYDNDLYRSSRSLAFWIFSYYVVNNLISIVRWIWSFFNKLRLLTSYFWMRFSCNLLIFSVRFSSSFLSLTFNRFFRLLVSSSPS